MKPVFVLLITSLLITSCSSVETYESDVFPDGAWIPINPEYFGKEEALRIYEGKIK